ncbi:hypothetical protein EON79_13900 [bacterium]|nr:MAG: hypothetical protein EON79_13900 [bacterium]
MRNDLLSGAVIALALIPEAISSSILAGLDRKVGLFDSFLIERPDRGNRQRQGGPMSRRG